MKKLIYIILFFGIAINYLYANDLMKLRSILGEEDIIQNEEITKNEEKNTTIKKYQSEYKKTEINYNILLEAPSNYYTINISTTNGILEAKNYLRNNNVNESNFYLYLFGPEMKNAKIIYGVFKSVDEAKEAMNKLPNSILENRPYVDNISKHQKLFLKYN